ncbi:hypothetical protein ZTR_07955 [Talaromyces verruculosus]|nr:hypothetical protein ZTR_07955 [Talaromyces verruculosus]
MALAAKIYVDGGCRGNGTPDSIGAAAAWIMRRWGERKDYVTHLPNPDMDGFAPTNQRAELVAIGHAFELLKEQLREDNSRIPRLDIEIFSDSNHSHPSTQILQTFNSPTRSPPILDPTTVYKAISRSKENGPHNENLRRQRLPRKRFPQRHRRRSSMECIQHGSGNYNTAGHASSPQAPTTKHPPAKRAEVTALIMALELALEEYEELDGRPYLDVEIFSDRMASGLEDDVARRQGEDTWIPRERNRLADEECNQCLDEQEGDSSDEYW